MKIKTRLLLALVVGTLAKISLMAIAYIDENAGPSQWFTSDGILILSGTFVGFSLSTLLLLDFYYCHSAKRRLLYCALPLLAGLAAYEYQTMRITRFVKIQMPPPHAYNGVYIAEISSIQNDRLYEDYKFGQQIGAQPLTLVITGHSGTIMGYQRGPVRQNNYIICTTEVGFRALNGTRNKKACNEPNFIGLALNFVPLTEGELKCTNCNEASFPSLWRKHR